MIPANGAARPMTEGDATPSTRSKPPNIPRSVAEIADAKAAGTASTTTTAPGRPIKPPPLPGARQPVEAETRGVDLDKLPPNPLRPGTGGPLVTVASLTGSPEQKRALAILTAAAHGTEKMPDESARHFRRVQNTRALGC